MTAGTSPLNTMFNDEVVYTEATAAQVLDPMVPDLGAAYHAPFSGGNQASTPLACCRVRLPLRFRLRQASGPMEYR